MPAKFTMKQIQLARRPAVDLAAYPILTEEVGYPPSPLATPSTTAPGGAPGGGSLAQMSARAVADVLGWKGKSGDAKGFVNALTQSFTITETEGHSEWEWTPRSYAVQTDLGGGITGAQASIYARAKAALDSALPLIDGLYALDPEAVVEDVVALKAVTRSQLGELVNEIGFLGGPRIQRVNEYFRLLLGPQAYPANPGPGLALTVTDPDQIAGTLGRLRDELGLSFLTDDFVNSVEDETDLSNYRIISDYVTSLAQSWVNNIAYVGLDSKTPFFGTQLVLLSRQLQAVAETVDEVRFTLDSVFIGPAERQTIELNFGSSAHHPMFLEDLLSWVRNFSTEEGPRLIQDGGKFGVSNTFLPVASRLTTLISNTLASSGLPPGLSAPRVRLAFADLQSRLDVLTGLATGIRHDITPEPSFGLPFRLADVDPRTLSLRTLGTGITPTPIYIKGSGFEYGASVLFSIPGTATPGLGVFNTYFRSENLLVVFAAANTNLPATPPPGMITLTGASVGLFDVSVQNADKSVSAALGSALSIEP
jgi:hypothetical protein